MDDKEILEYEIKGLKEANMHLANALALLTDIEAVTKEEYEELDNIQQEFQERIQEKENELEELKEEIEYIENKQQWQTEMKQQEQEYWNSQF